MNLLSEKLPQVLKKKLPEIVFDHNKGQYWTRFSPDEFVPRTAPQMVEEMQLDGVNTDVKGETGLSLGNEIIALARRKNFVHFAAPLSGYKCGFLETSAGLKVLVTRSSRPVAAGKSDHCPRFEKFIGALLKDKENQIHRFLGWLKVAYETLLRGDFAPGHLLVLAGPGSCGKSFLQILITELLGGTHANPYDYMTGKTNFNEDLSKAAHLAMGDLAADYQISARKKFAAKIKEFCVEPMMRIHGKGKEGVSLPTFRRLSISVNHEPEHMMIIPPLDDDMRPKIILLRCSDARGELCESREENMTVFRKELPAVARMLLKFKIPKAWCDTRFGVSAFHHPTLLDIVSDLTPEIQMLRVLDEALKWDDCVSWSGSAEQLKIDLLKTDFRETVSDLLRWSAACGTYLSRLQSKFPERFSATRSQGKTKWHIKAPN